MSLLKPWKLGLAAAVWILSSSDTAAGDTKFLPFFGPRLEAARYAPADEQFSWVGWIGARVDVVERGKWVGYFDANVETILGHRVRSFEAVQTNYSLEGGLRRELGAGGVTTFFHHVSRHIPDRTKFQVVDWNFLGLAFDSPWPKAWDRRGAWFASAGFTTLSSGVDYDWEARAAFDIDAFRKGSHAVFVLADVRGVLANPSPGFSRGSFADFRAEAGYRRFQTSSQFALFTALVADRLVLGQGVVA